MLGIGIGLLLGALLLGTDRSYYLDSDTQVEIKARAMGMEYPSEMKVDVNEEEKKW